MSVKSVMAASHCHSWGRSYLRFFTYKVMTILILVVFVWIWQELTQWLSWKCYSGVSYANTKIHCCLRTQIMWSIWCSINEDLPESLICIFWIPSLSDSQSWVSQNWVCDKSFFKPSNFRIMQQFLYALDLLHNVWHWLTAFQTLSCSYSDLLVLLIQNHEFMLLELHFSAFQFGGLLFLTVLHKDGTPVFFLEHPYFNM
jgi:hypothetical protein